MILICHKNILFLFQRYGYILLLTVIVVASFMPYFRCGKCCKKTSNCLDSKMTYYKVIPWHFTNWYWKRGGWWGKSFSGQKQKKTWLFHERKDRWGTMGRVFHLLFHLLFINQTELYHHVCLLYFCLFITL